MPIRMLGGSPISVAVPPILEANTSANKNGNGGTSSSSAIASVTGTIKSTVLTLLRTAERSAVAICSMSRMPAGFAFTRCADQTARYWNSPERREIATRIIMPVIRPIVSQSMPLDRLALIERADDDDKHRADQRHHGAIVSGRQ